MDKKWFLIIVTYGDYSSDDARADFCVEEEVGNCMPTHFFHESTACANIWELTPSGEMLKREDLEKRVNESAGEFNL